MRKSLIIFDYVLLSYFLLFSSPFINILTLNILLLPGIVLHLYLCKIFIFLYQRLHSEVRSKRGALIPLVFKFSVKGFNLLYDSNSRNLLLFLERFRELFHPELVSHTETWQNEYYHTDKVLSFFLITAIMLTVLHV